jgi:hypothetical protein
VIVQSESAEYIHEVKASQSTEVALPNKRPLRISDLLYAHPPDADICHYLGDNWPRREEYDWFMAGSRPATRSWATTITAATSIS